MKKIIGLFAVLGFCFVISNCSINQVSHDLLIEKNLQEINVKWDSLSHNSLGSMPAGNGDLGINLWVEENGDLLFYLSKTDAWSGNGRLLKIGKIRLALTPNPFIRGNYFHQELQLSDGIIRIEAGKDEDKISINIWVDANNPFVEMDVKSNKAVEATVSTEPWRIMNRVITNKSELHSAYGIQSALVRKDTILTSDSKNILWAHRNEQSIWEDNMKLQGLTQYLEKSKDPLLDLTFGAIIHSKQLNKTTPQNLESKKPLKKFSISIGVLTSQVEHLDDWIVQIQQITNQIKSKSRNKRLGSHIKWWRAFWDRSHIFVNTKDSLQTENISNVSAGYNLQRYINACNGRGNSPIKFNGSIFTVDTKEIDNRYGGFDADYRQWGGPYWWQNTRLPYWSMLEAGDFDLMKPLFKMYKDALDVRKFATRRYYGHDGAFYPETMRHWGTYVASNYGVDRSELPLGMTQNRYIRYYWQGGLELSLMMLDYYLFTQDEQFLKENLLPVVTEIITFFDQHWGRDDNGKILFDPAMALETYNTAVNPLPEIVGIRKVCNELIKLPESVVSELQRNQYKRLISELPEIPMQEVEGVKLLAPAYKYSGKQNIENPELYAIFPYRVYGVGKENLEMARNTFEKRAIKQTGGWQQNAIKAAYLGLSEESAKLVNQNYNASTSYYRFPTMWGPNYDWTPDQCHGGVSMIALQRMLLQYEGDEINLFPAWPENWDVEFKLLAPKNTTIEAKLKNGKIALLEVYPPEREKDIINHLPNTMK